MEIKARVSSTAWVTKTEEEEEEEKPPLLAATTTWKLLLMRERTQKHNRTQELYVSSCARVSEWVGG